MGDTNGTISYQSIYVNSGITANVISATTISANTFYGGSLSASFIGNGDVNDQQFKYISGITSDTQTQINEKVAANTNFLTYTLSQDTIPFSKKLEGVNVFLNQTQNEIEVSLPFNQTLFKQYPMSVSSALSSTAITNFNLSSIFNDSNRAVQIVITQGNAVISGISGGTDGNILMITNTSGGVIILENESTKCTPNDSIKFKFSFGEAFFLTYRKTIFLMYNSSEQCWKDINFGESNNQYDYINDFNKLFDFATNNGNSRQYNGLTNVGIQSVIGSVSLVGTTVPTDTNMVNSVIRTNFLDSSHVLKISLPQNTGTSNSWYTALHKPNRSDAYFVGNFNGQSGDGIPSMLNLYKFSLTATTFDIDYCFMFGFGDSDCCRRAQINGGGTYLVFRTPINSDSPPTNLQTSLVTQSTSLLTITNTVSTSLNLTSCINSWCYAGAVTSKIASTNYLFFFTSTNGNEYVIDRVSSGRYTTPFSMLRSTHGNTNTNSIFLDTYYQIDSGYF